MVRSNSTRVTLAGKLTILVTQIQNLGVFMSIEWFIKINGEVSGPISSKALKINAVDGKLSPHALIRKGESSKWIKASAIKGLFEKVDSGKTEISEEKINTKSFFSVILVGWLLVGSFAICAVTYVVLDLKSSKDPNKNILTKTSTLFSDNVPKESKPAENKSDLAQQSSNSENVGVKQKDTKGSSVPLLEPIDGENLTVASVSNNKSPDEGLTKEKIQTGSELILTGHRGPVYRAIYLPDGERILSCGEDRTVRLWNRENGEELMIFRGHEKRVTDVSVSPNMKWVASASQDGTVRIWDIQTGKNIERLVGHDRGVTSVAFSPDGKELASGGLESRLILWDTMTWKESKRLGSGSNKSRFHVSWTTSSICYLPNRQKIVTGAFGLGKGSRISIDPAEISYGRNTLDRVPDKESLSLWNIKGNANPTHFVTHVGPVRDVGSTEDGGLYISGGDDKIARIGKHNGKELHRELRADSAIFSVAISPDGTIALIASGERVIGKKVYQGRVIQVWDVEREKEIHRFEGTEVSIRSVRFSPDSKHFLMAGNDGNVREILIPTVSKRDHNLSSDEIALGPHLAPVTHVAFSKNGNQLTCYSAYLRDNLTRLNKMADSAQASLGRPKWNECRMWNLETGTSKFRWSNKNEKFLSLGRGEDTTQQYAELSPDGSLLLLQQQSSGKWMPGMYDTSTGNLLYPVKTFYEDNFKVVRKGNYSIKPKYTVRFSENGKYFASADKEDVCIWTTEGQAVSATITATAFPQRSVAVAIANNGKIMAIAGNNYLLLGTNSNKPVQLRGHVGRVHRLVFSPDDRFLLSSGEDNKIILWDANSGELIRRFEGHIDEVWALAFSDNGEMIASGSDDNTVRVWNVETGELLKTFSGHTGPVLCVDISQDGQTIASGSADRFVRIWKMPTKSQ